MTISDTVAQRLIWILWILQPTWGKILEPVDSAKRHIIEEPSGNIIEYFLHTCTEKQGPRFNINILVITGAGRVNDTANLAKYEEYLGPQYNICIPNLPGYGGTSGKLGIYATTEEQILHNQKLVIDKLGWDMSRTVFLGISYGASPQRENISLGLIMSNRHIRYCQYFETVQT